MRSIILFLFCGLFLALAAVTANSAEDSTKEILATVDDRSISAAELDALLKARPERLREGVTASVVEAKRFLDNYVDGILLAAYAREKGYGLKPWMQTYLDSVANSLIIEEFLATEVTGSLTISEEEISNFYIVNKPKYRSPATAQGRHILLRVPPDADEDEAAEVKKKAEGIRQRAVAGEDFSALAREYSEDTRTGGKGGEFGWQRRDALPKPFGDVLFDLEPGEIGEVVRTQFGFHVIRLDVKEPEKDLPLEQARASIVEALRGDAENARISELKATLRSSKKVEVLTENLKAYVAERSRDTAP